MIKQEFLGGRIVVYNADCLDVMRDIMDKEIDLVLTDPPYLYSDYSKGNKGFYETEENIKFVKSISNGFDVDKFFNEFKKISKKFNLYCCCSTKQLPEIIQWGYDNKYQVNLLSWKKGGSPFSGAYTSRVLEYISKRENGHPTEKPIKLFEKLAIFGTNEDDLIFDGFLGSGTTAIAAIKTKRRLIGCELDPVYFEKMCHRIDEELKQGSLF